MIGLQLNFQSNHNGKLHWCAGCPIVPKKEQSRTGFIGLCNVFASVLFGRRPMDDALKMAREVAVEVYRSHGFNDIADRISDVSSKKYSYIAVQSALAMHARMQGEVERKDALLREIIGDEIHGKSCARDFDMIEHRYYGECNCWRAASNKELGI